MARRGIAGLAGRGAARRGQAWQVIAGIAQTARRERGKNGFNKPKINKPKKMNQPSLIENKTTLISRNDEVKAELKAIEARRSGLTPTTLLHVAKNPKSCLHKYFCWDDTEAARRYREQQAYDLIRTVKTTITLHDKKELTIRAFFPVKQVEKDGTIDYSKRGSYMSIEDIALDEDKIEQVLSRAKSELAAFSAKYQSLASVAGFADVFDAISKVVRSKLN
jgi:hypothetical protein